jgi:hypothetical protein|tara:strand:- start:120 stop:584 length:465 start_codon:yes stop_codon:yes gene_type:complete
MNELSNYFKYYDELDDDLKNIVLSKIRNPQNKELLHDIVSYKKQKDIIFKKYLQNGFEYTEDFGDNLNIYGWIDNDLLGYYNNDIVYNNNNIIDCNIDKLLRQYSYKIKSKIKGKTNTIFNYHLNNKINAKSKINRYIGNLTINERDEFISKIN